MKDSQRLRQKLCIFLDSCKHPTTDFTATIGGKGQLEFPNNTLTQSTVWDVRKSKECPNINVRGAPMSRMGMCYR